jgi:hypothetical protein
MSTYSRCALLFSVFSVLTSACTSDAGSEAVSGEDAISQNANIWIGSPSATINRSFNASDPCGDSARLDDAPIAYGEFARTRATHRNVCFEVYQAGVTDNATADFSKLLNVQVHYKWKGAAAYRTDYVNSVDRRGNNRRYAWILAQDPMLRTSNAVDIDAPVEIASEDTATAELRSTLEFYFTVNGQKLTTTTKQNFRVEFTRRVEKRALSPLGQGRTQDVLYPAATCTGVTLGSGPGHFAADITDAAAIAEFTSPNLLPATNWSLTGTGASQVLTLRFNQGGPTAPGQFPNYQDGAAPSFHTETKHAGPGKVAVSMKAYDRTSRTVKTIRGCP